MRRGGNGLRIALVHDSLNPCGGAEKLSLAIARALKEMGHHVDIYVLEKTHWDRVERLTLYNRLFIDEEHTLPPFKCLPTIYSRLVHWFGRDILGYHVIKRHSYDLVIATKQILIPIFVDMLYMHFPDFLPGFDYLYYPERYLYNPYLRIYSRPLELATRALLSLFKRLDYKPLILTNSRFSKAIIRRKLGVKAVVLYPPVDVERYLPLSRHRERDNVVVTIGRLEPMKNLDIVLEVAKEAREAKFIILGTGHSSNYYATLVKKVRVYGLEGRVKILLNVSEEQKIEVLKRAKVYLHPTKYEHFGIAVVEAMAAGLVPAVHKSGGPWIDIIEHGKYGLGYKNINELIEEVNYLLSNHDAWFNFASKGPRKAKQYSNELFKLRLNTIFNNLIAIKHHITNNETTRCLRTLGV